MKTEYKYKIQGSLTSENVPSYKELIAHNMKKYDRLILCLGNITDILGGAWVNLKEIVKRNKWKSFRDYISLFLAIFQIVTSVIVYLFILLYPFNILLKIIGVAFIYDLGTINLFMLGIIWIVLFNDVLRKFYKNLESRKAIYYSAIVLLFIAFLSLINKSRAKNILNGKS